MEKKKNWFINFSTSQTSQPDPIIKATSLENAIETHSYEGVHFWIAKDPQQLFLLLEPEGITNLHLAATRCDPEFVRILLQHGAKIDATSSTMDTPLHYALRSGALTTSIFLIEKGAPLYMANVDGVLPIHLAAEKGFISICEMMISNGVSIDSVTRKGYTPLLYACTHNNILDVSKFFLNRGANVNACDFVCKSTPLVEAIYRKDYPLVRLLLSYGAELEHRDNTESTPLHWAARAGDLEIMTLLINRGAEVNVQDVLLNTPMHETAGNGNIEGCKLLCEKGARFDIMNFEGKKTRFWTQIEKYIKTNRSPFY